MQNPELVVGLLENLGGHQSDLLVLRVLHNAHHRAAGAELEGDHHIAAVLLEAGVLQDTLGLVVLPGMIELVVPRQVFEGGSQIGSCLLDMEEGRRRAGEPQVLRKLQVLLQGEEWRMEGPGGKRQVGQHQQGVQEREILSFHQFLKKQVESIDKKQTTDPLQVLPWVV